MKKKCENCHFYMKGWCQRFPPVLVRDIWDIPRVVSTSICGEWKKITEEEIDDDLEDLR